MAVALVAVAAALVVAVPGSAMPTAGVSFLAMGHTNTSSIITGDPPDPTGAVGPNHYVEAVNGGIEVFNKSGGVAAAAKSLNALWTGYVGTNSGNGCATHNDGDPIVRYDRLADRWLISQFSLPHQNNDAGPSFQCVAVSKTGDPTGAYWLYDFKYLYAINDYAKIGVWPDAYYATYNMFGTSAYKGDDICAWDRTAMLNGNPATQQCFFLPFPSEPACPAAQNFIPFGILPANDDGALPPPAGSPEYLMQFDYSQCSGPYNQLDLWKLHIDWTTPANSALSARTALTVSNFTPACFSSGAPNCIPQPGSTTKIDGLDDRLMDRLVYRNYGTHESLFANHTVTAGAGAGIRWYEIRSPDTTPTIFQQGTYAPADSNWRWMGSIAADQAGDIGLGYSVSDSSGGVSRPSIAWTGRLSTDTLGTMGQGETVLHTGAADAPDDYGTGRARWGDYTSMTVDPTDDCTFWYLNEVSAAATFGWWDTYIQSVKFPNCAQNDFTIAPTGAVTALQGSSGTTTISTALSKGTAESVQLTAFDLPQGATASFVPSTVSAGGSSTLTLTAGANTPAGTYTVEVAGTAPSALHGTPVTFTVDAAPAPTCTDRSASTAHNTAVAVSLPCSAPGAITYSIVSPPSHGTLGMVGATGDVTYTPTSGFDGTDSFTFNATDTHAQTSNVATATITIGSNQAPTCPDQTISVRHNTAKHLVLGCSDADPGATLHWSIVTPPGHGTASAIDGTGGMTYKPRSAFGGLDRFTFKATDDEGADSNVATITLHVAKLVPCAGLTGKKLRACKAKLKLKAALKRCARIKSKKKRTACIKKARHAYRRALQARVSQARVSGKAPTGHRPPPLLVYQVPRRR